MKEIGVPAPPQVPMIYDLSTNLITTNNSISVIQESSSGEAEVVIMKIEGKWYLGLGSDHTDRGLEKSVYSEIQTSMQQTYINTILGLG
ncbi:DUF2848 family protein [Peribacillus frigoritolerans]|nr:DUF2848 family protein [Peribacillus frigoritolerans]